MTHAHARRDGLPVADPDLCFACNRAELRRHPLAGNALHPVGLPGSPYPAKDDQRLHGVNGSRTTRPDGRPAHHPLTAQPHSAHRAPVASGAGA